MKKAYHVEKVWIKGSNVCVVLLNLHAGDRYGYVGITPNHPLYNVRYNDEIDIDRDYLIKKNPKIDDIGIMNAFFAANSDHVEPSFVLEVHGGLSYSKGHFNYPIDVSYPDKLTTRSCATIIYPLWWFGFDCGHYGDSPDYEAVRLITGKDPSYMFMLYSGTVRTLDYCIDQTNQLSDQLDAIQGELS